MSYAGGKIADSLVNDDTDSTVYTSKLAVSNASTWSLHLDISEDTATYAAAVTLWASNKPNPDESDDTDWVQMTSDHGWDGFPGGDPAGGDVKDLVDVSASGARWYRLKFVRSSGAATINVWAVLKGLK